VDEEDLTADGMAKIIASKRAVAAAFKEDRDYCREAWIASGFAVEIALKRLILLRAGYNAWPSRDLRPDLHVHNLRDLLGAANLSLADVPKEVRPSLRLVFDWIRGHDYTVQRMPRRVARDMFEAAFGERGVVPWLATITP
jgi:hypothetical protein